MLPAPTQGLGYILAALHGLGWRRRAAEALLLLRGSGWFTGNSPLCNNPVTFAA
jgi:hypothetical protein